MLVPPALKLLSSADDVQPVRLRVTLALRCNTAYLLVQEISAKIMC